MGFASRIARARGLGLAAASLILVSFLATTAAADALLTTTELTASSEETLFGQPVTLTAEVRARGATVEDSLGAGHVALGYFHSCALMAGGTVKCWGYNPDGQLGYETPTGYSSIPIEVPGLSGVKALAASYLHSCAVMGDGTVKCWGDNHYGQLGDGTKVNHPTPTDVPDLTGVTALSLGFYHSCALITDGTVKCWGYDYSGQLGDGTPSDFSLSPTLVPDLTGVTALASSDEHMCALIGGGTVKCWGYNGYGELGDGKPYDHYTPETVPDLSGVTALSLSYTHSCALINDGTVKCWGLGYYGLYGELTPFDSHPTPTEVPGVSGVSAFAMGDYHYCALINDGTVKCWGYNGYGQLGDGTNLTRYTPAEVPGLTNVTGLFANENFTGGADRNCALIRGGALKCWGSNSYGQLGDGSIETRLSPVAIVGPASGAVSILDGASEIGSGTLTNGSFEFITSSLAVGPYTLKAKFVANPSFDASESSELSHEVLDGDDKVPPTISAPPSITVNTDLGLSTAVVLYDVSAMDNVDGDVPVTLESGPASGAEFPLGSTQVTVSATDNAGNKATASFLVTVIDGEAPVITVPGDISVDADPGLTAAVVNFSVTAWDNVDGPLDPEKVSALGAGDSFPVGETVVEYSATDAANNTSSASFKVTVTQEVSDNVPPVVTVPANITVSNDPCFNSAVVNYSKPTAEDNFDGAVPTYLTAGLESGSPFPVGVTTVTWSAKDAAENIGSASFTVTVNKQTAATDDDDELTGTEASETIFGLRGNDKLCALGGNDKLYGGPGDDYLNGGEGADDMHGEEGDDVYVVDNSADRVFERYHWGWDSVHSSVTFQLSHSVEELQLEGSEPINGYGNEKTNRLIGNSANNRLHGSGGGDYVEGKGGGDFMDGGSGADTLSYAQSPSAVIVDLASETSSGGDAEGDSFDRFQNVLGSPKADTLSGDKWRNKISGGLGGDTLTGRDGKDDFAYAQVNESRPDQPDVITDFSKGDEIDLSAIDAVPGTPLVNDAFKFIGSAAFSGQAGQLRFEGGKLLADVDGNGVADMAIVLNNVNSIKASQIEL